MGRTFQQNNLNRRDFLIAVAAGLVAMPGVSLGQQNNPPPRQGRNRRGGGDDPQLPAELVLPLVALPGRVTDRSACLHLLGKEKSDLTIRYGTSSDRLGQSQKQSLRPGEPMEVELSNLKPGTEYFYQITGDTKTSTKGRFHTQRAAGQTFTFTIQGDSHPERPQMFDAKLYTKTLQAVAGDKPDFHLCMGDDFSLARLNEYTEDSIASRYRLQRPFLGIVGAAAPVFLLNGNHEQASLYNYNQTDEAHNVAIWAQLARNKYFPLPSPDRFYSGNTSPVKEIGDLRDYQAWTWGDALFVILDNYWHSPASVDTKLREEDTQKTGRDRDFWGMSMGDEQYNWFKKTLETSRAKYKFVFAHHVMGTGRGAIERARLFEWGDTSSEFKKYRPKWEMPVHDLMKKHGVNIFFQGHDHLYARQELDGIIYQTVPVPADAMYQTFNENRYLSGTKLPNSGYLRVTVGPKDAKVEYVRQFLNDDAQNKSGSIAHSYSV